MIPADGSSRDVLPLPPGAPVAAALLPALLGRFRHDSPEPGTRWGVFFKVRI